MTYGLVFAVSLLAALLAVALVRERRLRLALQTLLIKAFHIWRNTHEERYPGRARDPDSDVRGTRWM